MKTLPALLNLTVYTWITSKIRKTPEQNIKLSLIGIKNYYYWLLLDVKNLAARLF